MIVRLYIISLVLLLPFSEAFSILPRSPKGASGGGGGSHGGGGGGHASGGGSHGSTGSSGGSHGSTGSSGSSHGSTSEGDHSGSSGSGSSGSGSSGGGGSGSGSSGGSGSGGGSGSSSGGSSSGSHNSGSSRSASTGRGSSGDTGHPSISSSFTSRAANYFSGGGGKRITIPSGSAFSGRQMGGGTREEVLGTRRFGSGYPYHVNDPQTRGVHGNPFPFGFWPLYWHGHGYSDEYGNDTSVAGQRPGGSLWMVPLAIDSEYYAYNASAIEGLNETYWMVGDGETVTTILSVLEDPPEGSGDGGYPYGCGVSPASIVPFNSSDPSLPFHIQNVMQWYRSSSFAFVYTGYNNTYAFAPLNETSSLDESTPLPEPQLDSPFVQCINNTITASIAILDEGQTSLSAGEIAGIVIGSVVGAVLAGLAGFAAWYLVKRRKNVTYKKLEGAEAEKIETEKTEPKKTEPEKTEPESHEKTGTE